MLYSWMASLSASVWVGPQYFVLAFIQIGIKIGIVVKRKESLNSYNFSYHYIDLHSIKIGSQGLRIFFNSKIYNLWIFKMNDMVANKVNIIDVHYINNVEYVTHNNC